MPNNKQMPMNNSPMYFWVLVVILFLILGFFFFKKYGYMGKLAVPQESQTTGQETIDNATELKATSDQLDQTNVDGSVDSELRLLDQDASVMVNY